MSFVRQQITETTTNLMISESKSQTDRLEAMFDQTKMNEALSIWHKKRETMNTKTRKLINPDFCLSQAISHIMWLSTTQWYFEPRIWHGFHHFQWITSSEKRWCPETDWTYLQREWASMQKKRESLWTWDHLCCWSDPAAPTEGVVGTLPAEPFSMGGGTPHFPSDSRGSNTWTPPSDSPTANWFASCGCAAMTSGWTLELLHIEIIKDHQGKLKVIHR